MSTREHTLLASLPSTLDQSDPDACRAFYYSEDATEQQRDAIVHLAMKRASAKALKLVQKLRELRKDVKELNQSMVYSEFTRSGGPIRPAREKHGKFFPDGMPEQYQEFMTFDDVLKLPIAHLDEWLKFHEVVDRDLISTEWDKRVELYVTLGGTTNKLFRARRDEHLAEAALENSKDPQNSSKTPTPTLKRRGAPVVQHRSPAAKKARALGPARTTRASARNATVSDHTTAKTNSRPGV